MIKRFTLIQEPGCRAMLELAYPDGFHEDEVYVLAADYEALADRLATCERELAAYHGALQEIAEGKGAYSRDHVEHACNTIRDMKERANQAVKARERGH